MASATSQNPLNQLALLTAIRNLFMQNEVNFTKDALDKTPIMSLLSKIFYLQSNDEETYFLKLEALWILINLAFCDTDYHI